MALADLYANDLDYIPDPRTVTIRAKRADRDILEAGITHAKQLNASEVRQLLAGVTLKTGTRGYLIPHNELSTITTIENGDELKDMTLSKEFLIDQAERVHFDHQWILLCIPKR